MKRLAIFAVVPCLLYGCLGKAMLDADKSQKEFKTDFETMFKEKTPEDIAKLFESGPEARGWLSDPNNQLMLSESPAFPNVDKSLYDNGCPMVKVGSIMDLGDGKKTAMSVIAQMPTSASQRALVWQIHQTIENSPAPDSGEKLVLFGF